MTDIATTRAPRVEGLDLARFVAFCGMVLVNYQLMMGVWEGDGFLVEFIEALHGRAAGTFVFLAGMGVALNHRLKGADSNVPWITAKRGVFLLVLGLLSHAGYSRIGGEDGLQLNPFSADILRFYGLYFLIAACFLKRPWFVLALGILAVNGLTWMVIVQGHLPAWIEELLPARGAGWRWLEYPDFWSPREAGRYLFFNGWHPVFPWVSLVLLGMWIGRGDLASRRLHLVMIVAGVAGFFGLEVLLDWMREANHFDLKRYENRALTGTSSWVLGGTTQGAYALSAACTSSAAIGTCLLLASFTSGTRGLRWLCNAGRLALTLYIAHIWLGMNVQRWIGWDAEGQPGIERVWIFSLSFMLLAVVFANLWLRRFQRGPLESVMRRITG